MINIAVQTNVEVVYYPRTQKKGTIIVEAKINPVGNLYQIDITDHVRFIETIEGVDHVRLVTIEQRLPLYKTKQEIDYFYNLIGETISEGDSYADKDILIKKSVLLHYIKNDFLDENNRTIYNLLPENWVEYVDVQTQYNDEPNLNIEE